MKCLRISLVVLLLVAPMVTHAEQEKIVRVYGPGGPHRALSECADLFEQKSDVEISIIKALPHQLERKVRVDGDIYYGGAEYMLDQFHDKNPDVLDMSTFEKLHPRRIGILVRKGNPLQLEQVQDLQKGVVVLDVKLENMRHLNGLDDGMATSFHLFAYTGRQGADIWLSDQDVDAWVTYKSWYYVLRDKSDFVEIPGEGSARYTPLALTNHTENPREARAFIDFLKTEEARQVFERHGWY